MLLRYLKPLVALGKMSRSTFRYSENTLLGISLLHTPCYAIVRRRYHCHVALRFSGDHGIMSDMSVIFQVAHLFVILKSLLQYLFAFSLFNHFGLVYLVLFLKRVTDQLRTNHRQRTNDMDVFPFEIPRRLDQTKSKEKQRTFLRPPRSSPTLPS